MPVTIRRRRIWRTETPVIPEAEAHASRLFGTSRDESNLTRFRLEVLLAFGSHRFGRNDGWEGSRDQAHEPMAYPGSEQRRPRRPPVPALVGFLPDLRAD